MIATAEAKMADSAVWSHLVEDLEAIDDFLPEAPSILPLMEGRWHAERIGTLRAQIKLRLAEAWERMVLAQRHAFELEFIANEKESERN